MKECKIAPKEWIESKELDEEKIRLKEKLKIE
jgi:hypothetical protein